MKKVLQIVIITVLIGCIVSCSDKRKELAEKATMEFFSAIKNGNKSKMVDLYPEFEEFSSYYKSDEYIIKETKVLSGEKVSVTVDNYYTNPFGKKSNQTIILFLKPDGYKKDVYKIYDSKGLTDYTENDIYIFATKTGCINKYADLTDQEIVQKLEIAKKMILSYSTDIHIKLLVMVNVTSWNWERGYNNSANGRGIVKNNSEFNLPYLKYRITYFDRNDNEITSDNGYVTHDKFSTGSSKSFTFYTSYVGNAYRARVGFDFDAEILLELAVNKDYTGKEFEEFQTKQKIEKD